MRRIMGALTAILGLAVVGGLGALAYVPEGKSVLVDLGIPGTLLLVLVGLVLALVGSAAVVRDLLRPGAR